MIKASKKLGQNWLINPSIHRTIVEAAEISPTDNILEIGPGTGLLTEYLAKTGSNLIAVEKDKHLISILQDKFKNQKNVKIVEGDILNFNPEKYELKEGNYKVIGNIPYYLTSHLLKITLEKWPRPKLILLTVQKEVAKRIVAKPPDTNLLGLSVKFYADAKIIRHVSKKNFRPVPKVDSAVVKIIPRKLDPFLLKLAPDFFRIAQAGFRGKRKQILNSLSSGLKIPRVTLGKRLEEAGIDPKRRPETLNFDEWIKLSQILS